MLDKKWIKNNPDAFDKAMESRNCPIRSKNIIPLIDLSHFEKQIKDLNNEIKKLRAEHFVKSGKEDKLSENLTALSFKILDKEVEVMDMMIALWKKEINYIDSILGE